MNIFDVPLVPPSEKAPTPSPTHHLQVNLDLLSPDELLELRKEIDQRLPTSSLNDLNLEKELVLQLLTVQKLQREVLAEADIPANQKAQTVNAVAANLATLAKLQTEVYTSERLKKVEQALVEALHTLPTSAQEVFIEQYEDALGKSL